MSVLIYKKKLSEDDSSLVLVATVQEPVSEADISQLEASTGYTFHLIRRVPGEDDSDPYIITGSTQAAPAENTTPAAPSFTAFNDTANTVTLVPVAGIPMADYRYTMPGSATAYTAPDDGVISVGNVAGSVTAYSVAADGRNPSPTGTSQSFTFTAPPANNVSPTVTLAIDDNSITTAEQAILTATPSDTDGTISKVELYRGANLLGARTAAPYVWNVNALAIGDYSFTAKAYDNSGASTVSSPVSLSVTAEPAPAAPVLVIDDANNTATITPVAGFPNISDYEYRVVPVNTADNSVMTLQ